MKKRFKTRNKFKDFCFKTIFLIIIVIFSFGLFFKFFYNKIDINIDNKKYLNYLINDSLGNYNIGDITSLTSTEFLLKYSLGIDKADTYVSKEVTSDININEEEIKEPIIYLYNSHQTEEYTTPFLESFNINNTVLIASYILKEYLNDLGLKAIVEENKVADILDKNNWKYGYSYKASRELLESSYQENPTLKYFFDVHRDSSSYQNTVTEIDGKKYARVLFVVGLEHPNYEENLQETEKINAKIKDFNVSLSRGIMKKKGQGVNGIYNQDFSKYTFLLEIGGQYNTIEEINNTLKVLAKVLYDYILEVEDEKEN